MTTSGQSIPTPTDHPEELSWPARVSAWYAVLVLAVVLMFGQVEATIITFLIAPIKRDFKISDLQVSALVGVAPAIFYAVVGLPLARLVDTLRRNVVLSVALGIGGIMTSAAGLAQSFWQFGLCRVLVGGGGAVSNPGTYSIIADYFPRDRLPRAIAVLSLGLILGRSVAPVMGGVLVGLTAGWSTLHVVGLNIRNWQITFILSGCLGLIGAALMLTVREPARRNRLVSRAGTAPSFVQVLGFIWRRRDVYAPQFLALAFYAVESYGLESWRVEFLRRTYGWSAQFSGPVLGGCTLAAQMLGLFVGTRLAESLSRYSDDANLRTVGIFYLIAPPFAVLGPLMPNPWLAILCSSITGLCNMACVPAQNAALQNITPNEMRGQVTAMYYFVLSAIGLGLGPSLMAFITDYVIGNEDHLRYAMASTAAIMLPVAAVSIWCAVKPYGRAMAEARMRTE
jgi:MFS family permease